MFHPGRFPLLLLCSLVFLSPGIAAQEADDAPSDPGDLAGVKTLSVQRSLTPTGRGCITCHRDINPGVVNDWKNSRHGHVGVSCIDCHAVPEDSAMAVSHDGTFDLSRHDASLLDPDVAVSALVPPSTCARCHAEEYGQFAASGHFRAYHQIIPKDNLHALTEVHEGRNHPELKGAPSETGCMQCHGTKIALDEDNRPTPETWPNAGMGNIYPDGSTGNCGACHTRHRFAVTEARKPHACASCHLGPDHPNIEIFEASKHGHIYLTQGEEWDWDTAPGARRLGAR